MTTERAMTFSNRPRSQPPLSRKERRRAKKLESKHQRPRSGGASGPILEDLLRTAMQLARSGTEDGLGKGLRLLIDAANSAPDDPVLHCRLGEACCDLGNLDLAYRFLKQAVSLDQTNARAWTVFATCLWAQKHFEASRIAAESAVRLSPENSSAHLILGKTLFFLDDTVSALKAFDLAVATAGGTVAKGLALLEKGYALQANGDIEGARAAFFDVLEGDPGNVKAIAALVDLRTSFDDPTAVLARLDRSLATGKLDRGAAAAARFAAGRILASQKRFDDAFPHFIAGNRIRAAGNGFDIKSFDARFDRLIATFTPDLVEALADLASPTEQPVFIVGMPRSGTTLTEAILARHPAIAARGERAEFPQMVASLSTDKHKTLTASGEIVAAADSIRFPEDLANMDRDQLRTLRDQYVSALADGLPENTVRFTDKMPLNFIHLGLIGLFFPRARIVHCVRSPMDTCLSCFLQNFADELPYTYDLADLGRFYRQYVRLMAHWKSLFPGRIFDLVYEDLIADQEEKSRALIAHVGVDWSEDCLTFQDSDFHTKTASNWQVRQKIYTTSLEAWRKYERFLQPLKDGLGETA